MAFNRPLLSDLITRTRNDTVSRLPDPDVLRRSNAEVYVRTLAGAAHGLYGYIDWLSRQLIYDTAETDMLERWSSIWGIARKPATVATGSATFTGNNGVVIPAGTIVVSYDGVLYDTDNSATISAGQVVTTLSASATGINANRLAGAVLTLQSPIPGITATAIAGILTGGTDIESDDSLRARLLLRIRKPPQGGCLSDYEGWALAVPGVTRAWVSPREMGAGTVTVRFMMDDTYSNGIPLTGDLTAVANYIAGLRPVTAVVYVLAPVPITVNFTISSLQPALDSVKTAIAQELADLFKREAGPGGGIYLSHVREAISIAAGEVDHVLVSPSANISRATGELSVLGTITWT